MNRPLRIDDAEGAEFGNLSHAARDRVPTRIKSQYTVVVTPASAISAFSIAAGVARRHAAGIGRLVHQTVGTIRPRRHQRPGRKRRRAAGIGPSGRVRAQIRVQGIAAGRVVVTGRVIHRRDRAAARRVRQRAGHGLRPDPGTGTDARPSGSGW